MRSSLVKVTYVPFTSATGVGARTSSGCRWTSSREQDRLGDAILAYTRRLTADPSAAVNVILPERLHENLRLLRGRRALAIKRCLLFEPRVILSSVPSRSQ